MSPTRRRGRLSREFNLGIEQAEVDPLLSEAFVESGDYSVLSSKTDPRCFVVARTGSGKSAALQHLEEIDPEHVIRISPENLSLPYITNLGVIKYLDSLEVHLDPFFIALWKHVLLVELLKHRYKIDSPAAKQTFLATLRQRISRDQAKRQAVDYLEEFQDRFWCETDERVRDIVEKFEEKVGLEAKGQIALPGVGGAGLGSSTDTVTSTESRREAVDRFQRVVNETQLPRLNKMIEVLDDEVLDRQHFTFVVIDDLDRDWIDERVSNSLVRCLFRAVQDLKRVRNLKVLVALRANIFQELEFAERFGQEEKLRALVLELRWTRVGLQEVLDERTRAAAEIAGIEGVARFADVLPRANKARGNPLDYLLDRTLLRPRDVISFANECLNLAAGKNSVTWDMLHEAEQPYSEKRLLALRDEWKSTYPDIHRVFEVFRGAPSAVARADFTILLDNIALLIADPDFRGVSWLTPLSESLWSPLVDSSDWVRIYQGLLRFLYGIGFVGCSESRTSMVRYAYEAPAYIERSLHLTETAWFHIHPTYRSALEVVGPRRQEPPAVP
jgi:hypothetical protein